MRRLDAEKSGVTLMGAYLPVVKRAAEIRVSLVFSKICAARAVLCDARRASGCVTKRSQHGETERTEISRIHTATRDNKVIPCREAGAGCACP